MEEENDTVPALKASVNEAAFGRQETFIRSLKAGQLVACNRDVTRTVGRVLSAVPHVMQCRAELLTLPKFDLAECERLHDLALSVLYLCGRCAAATGSRPPLKKRLAQGVVVRRRLLNVARVLADEGLVRPIEDIPLRGHRSAADCSRDISILFVALTSVVPTPDGRTFLAPEEFRKAECLAIDLMASSGARDQNGLERAALRLLRRQAFTRMVKVYEEVRFHLGCLYRDRKTVNTIAPSLYARPKGPREQNDKAKRARRASEHPTLGGKTEAANAEPLPPAPGLGSRDIAPGLPGSSPFV